MCRKAKRSGGHCPKHRFELRPVHYSAFMTSEVEATFCPKTVRGQSGTPHFNKDRNYFTPCFVLPATKKETERIKECHRLSHERSVADHSQEKQQILVARPSSRNNYCAACNNDYEDYLQHVHSFTHLLAIRTNPYSALIADLCQPPCPDAQSQPHMPFTDAPSTPLRLSRQDTKLSFETIQSTRSLPLFDLFHPSQRINDCMPDLIPLLSKDSADLPSPHKRCTIVVRGDTKGFPSITSFLQEECK